MKIRFDYDRAGLEVALPATNVLAVVESQARSTDAASSSVVDALHAPIGSRSLGEIARGRTTACVVIPDVTRPLPLKDILPPLLTELEEGGIARDAILILIATGLHRPNVGEELEEMVGGECARRYRFENHMATDASSHVDLGSTSLGIRADVDRRLVEADLSITVGLVEPHFMAGFSGGRKLVCPGVCSETTIRAFHGFAILNSPEACNCNLIDNPIHETSTDVARMVGIDFSVNVVIDDRRTIRAVHAGALEASFLAACESAAALTTFPIPHHADIVVVSGGGYPLDATWYQSIKGLVAAEAAVREGGTIVLATGLSEGVGSRAFGRLLAEAESLDAFMAAIQSPDYYRSEQWQLQMFARVARKARVLLYSSGVADDVASRWFVERVASVEEGVARALSELGAGARIIAMPHGPYVIPVCAAHQPA